jgi:ubiquinone/menaquinone biosynthesis C-methylase UbiE
MKHLRERIRSMTESTTEGQEQLREAVRQRYAAVATRVTREHTWAESALPVLDAHAGCSSDASCSCGTADTKSVITSDLYAVDEVADLPSASVLASLGWGNPTALAELRSGETVLDLGSGGGIDVLLSAKRVGPTGFVYGLDMTDEMLTLAEKNRLERSVQNARFLKGNIEQIPLPNDSVDVITSNCVINLSGDKPRVLREAFRVLKPGGRFAVSDVVVQGELPAELRKSMELWAGCIAGALQENSYRQLLAEAGFAEVSVRVTRVYDAQDLAASECCGGSLATQSGFAGLAASGGRLVSAFLRATKPVGATSGSITMKGSACCSTATQATWCESSDKPACCETGPITTSSGCGCC